MKQDQTSRKKRALSATLLSLILITFYLLTLLPGVGYSGDTAKFDYVGHILGTPHTTGYPTFILLNHFFTKVFPVGSIAYRANLLSAVFAAAACVVLFYFLLSLNLTIPIAFFCSLLFGFTRTFWSQAVVAEVYTLNLLFVSLVFYLLLRWKQTGSRNYFFASCAVYAISFGHHLTMITLLPAFFYFVWVTDRSVFVDRKAVVVVSLFILAGALQYSYLIWRFYAAPDLSYLELQTPNLTRFLFAVTGASFKENMFAFPFKEVLLQRIPMYGKLVWFEYSLLIPFAVYGWFQIKDRTTKIFLLLAFAGNLFYALNYDIPDVSLYFIPGYFVLVICIASAFSVIRFLNRQITGSLVLAALPLFFVLLNYQQVDQSSNTEEAEEARIIFDSLENDAVIITNYNFSQYFWYFMFEENLQHKRIHIFRNVPPPPAIKDFLEGRRTLFVRESRQKVPFGSPVYSMTMEHRLELSTEGLRLVRTDQRHVLRVLARTTP